MKILGISAFYHDAAAALVVDGMVVSAAQEERFTRKKNDAAFPTNAIQFCLKEQEISLLDLNAIVFYDKPFLKFERLLESYTTNAPFGLSSFITAMPVWLKEKLFLKDALKKSLKAISEKLDFEQVPLLFSTHHLSHAASAFYPSGFQSAAIVTIDGVGEWATASIATGQDSQIVALKEMHYPDSIGLLYSAFTYYLGFEVNSGEYKMMGLAPFGNMNLSLKNDLKEKIVNEILTCFDDGSIRLNPRYFSYSTSLKMIKEKRWVKLLGEKRRKATDPIQPFHYCLALAIQELTEECVLRIVKHAKSLTGAKKLCLAGGVALNCVANGKIQSEQLFDEIFIQPAAGDAGGALGAALAAYHMHFEKARLPDTINTFNFSRLGPSFSDIQIIRSIEKFGLQAKKYEDEDLISFLADEISAEKVVGWFQDKMEFGPRALGGRSILGNPLSVRTQSQLNLKVKKRESFRPFAPIMLKEEFLRFYGQNYDAPYMLTVHPILPAFQTDFKKNETDLIYTVNQARSVLPSITHVDYTSRIQTITKESDAKLFALLNAFKSKTGYGVLVNTSFNLKDEPIVCSPSDAIRCYLSTAIDILVLGNYVIQKAD